MKSKILGFLLGNFCFPFGIFGSLRTSSPLFGSLRNSCNRQLLENGKKLRDILNIACWPFGAHFVSGKKNYCYSEFLTLRVKMLKIQLFRVREPKNKVLGVVELAPFGASFNHHECSAF